MELKGLTDRQKQAIIKEHPGGIWIVLAEEYPRGQVTAADLLGIDDSADGFGDLGEVEVVRAPCPGAGERP